MEDQNTRYEMCEDQPAQIDCRNIKCIYHKEGSCTNVSPAITINDDSVTCWSKKEKTLEVESIINIDQAKKEIDKFFAPFIKEGAKALPTQEQYREWAKDFAEKVVEINNGNRDIKNRLCVNCFNWICFGSKGAF